MQVADAKTNALAVLLLTAGLLAETVPSQPAQGQDAPLARTGAAAQAETNGVVQGGAGYFAAGVRFRGLQLPGRGAARLFSLGGSGYGAVGGGVLIGGAGYQLFASGGGFQRDGASTNAGYGLFTLGYHFRPASQLYAHPQVGFGAGNLDVEVEEGARRFDGFLDDPNRGASYEKRAFLLHLGGGLEYHARTAGVEAGAGPPGGPRPSTSGNRSSVRTNCSSVRLKRQRAILDNRVGEPNLRSPQRVFFQTVPMAHVLGARLGEPEHQAPERTRPGAGETG
jgi:hypothetical protein